VIETAVEHRIGLVVLLGLGRIGSRYKSFVISSAVNSILNDYDLACRTKLFGPWIDNHGPMNAALNVKIGHRAGRAVIHEDSGRVDSLYDRHRFSRQYRAVMPRVDFHRVRI